MNHIIGGQLVFEIWSHFDKSIDYFNTPIRAIHMYRYT